MKFGDYIRQKRENAGWTQPEAAAKIDIEQSYLSKLETGKSYPSEDIFQRLKNTYAIDMNELGQKVFSNELNKLREIGNIRTLMLKRYGKETKYLRGWLAAGLVSLMIGTGLVVYQTHQGHYTEWTYKYQSPGVIKAGESVRVYERLKEREELHDRLNMVVPSGETNSAVPEDTPGESYSERLDYHRIDLSENLGPVLIKTVEGGRRRYKLVNESFQEYSGRNDMLLALGVALLAGGFSSFFLSRRWR